VQSLIHALQESDEFATVTLAFVPPEEHCTKRVGATKMFGSSVQRRNAAAQPRSSEVPLGPGAAVPFKTSSPPLQPLEAAHKFAIPSRFTSQDACETTTANCTGHGECKIVARDVSGGHTNLYFGCVCNKPVVRKNKDGGTKTTYFGGAACHKKSVVAPFWLLAGTSIFLLTVLSIGLGLLYSMGSEELPSVIGAGVSGPRAK
jgi:hypothetical protein